MSDLVVLAIIPGIALVMFIRWLTEDSELGWKWKALILLAVIVAMIALVAARNGGTGAEDIRVPEEPPRIVISISQGKMRILYLDKENGEE